MVGVFGGTFDPIHQGHVDLARAAIAALSLDYLLVIPNGAPQHRDTPVANANHRLRWAETCFSEDANVFVDPREVAGNLSGYSVDTLESLIKQPPERLVPSKTIHWVWLTGTDAFADLGTWSRVESLPQLCHFAVISRAGCDPLLHEPRFGFEYAESPAMLRQTGVGYWCAIQAETMDISSTALRAKMANRETVWQQLPDHLSDIQRAEIMSAYAQA